MCVRRSENRQPASSRREFLKTTTTAAVGMTMATGLSIAQSAHAAGSDTIKIALVGCGGRGTGAAVNAMNTKANVKLVAMADAFRDSLDASLTNLRKECGDRIDVPEKRQFIGMDAYEKAIACNVDVVLLCSPPGFRPMHFEDAVKAGRHVFMEKPLATDAPGVRRIMAANEEAKKKHLAVAVGHHLRHEAKHREIIRAHSRWRDRRVDVSAGVFQRQWHLDPSAPARPVGDAVSGKKLVPLHLAQRRPYRRTGRA